MTQSKSNNPKKTAEDLVAEEAAINGLLFWINSATALHGANFAINYLLNGIKEMIEHVATPDRIDHVEDMLTKSIAESCDIVRQAAMSPEEKQEEDLAVLDKKLTKLFH